MGVQDQRDLCPTQLHE